MVGGEALKAWRIARGLTRRQLAGMLSVTETTIYRWESGDRQPPGGLLELALEALDRRLAQGQDR